MKSIRTLTMLSLCMTLLIAPLGAEAKKSEKKRTEEKTERQYWCDELYKMAYPILHEMSREQLHANMPIEVSPQWDGRNKDVTYMEAFGRLMDGLAPWLTLPDDDTPEGLQRKELREMALKCYKVAVDPDSPDYLLWRSEGQTLVDAAFLAESFLRGFDALWLPLDEMTKQRYIEEFTQLRRVTPAYSNWLLFASTVECFLMKVGAPYDNYRITMAFNKMEEWYVGDGWYSDGPAFAFNYYNSYVIQPMYVECLETVAEQNDWRPVQKASFDKALGRMQRHGVSLERLISPEGTFPAIGRSLTYRTGALLPLALLAWREWLPESLAAGQVRAAMTAVIKRMFNDSNANYNEHGYLRLGFNGAQPDMSDSYTNTGSLYLASFAFLPLGLPADHPFWTDESLSWTSKKAWEGDSFPKDATYNK